MFTSKDIANYFIDKSVCSKDLLTPMKLIKLVYISYGWYLGLTKGKTKLFSDDQPEAWEYGPVLPNLYHDVKYYGSDGIPKLIESYSWIDDGYDSVAELNKLKNDPLLVEFLDKIYEVYNGFSAIDLSNLTHMDGTPWSEARESGAMKQRGYKISDAKIASHYIKKSKGKS